MAARMKNYFFLFFVVVGCEEVVDTPAIEKFDPVLVVEGMFTNEERIHTVTLSRSVPVNYSGSPTPVSGAIVFIRADDKIIPMVEKIAGTGVYETTRIVNGQPGHVYELSVSVDGKEYTAIDTMEPVTPLDGIRYSHSVSNGMYEWTVPNDHSLSPGTTYEWQAAFVHTNGDIDKITYYNFTGLETAALFALNQMSQTIWFEPGTKIVQKKYSLSKSYYEFLRAVYIETDWRGGLYDINPANVPTNVTNGATGFFRVSAVATFEQLAP
jgi:hypothetical protein